MLNMRIPIVRLAKTVLKVTAMVGGLRIAHCDFPPRVSVLEGCPQGGTAEKGGTFQCTVRESSLLACSVLRLPLLYCGYCPPAPFPP